MSRVGTCSGTESELVHAVKRLDLTCTRLLALCAFGLAGCTREVRGRVVDLHTIPYALVLTAARRDD